DLRVARRDHVGRWGRRTPRARTTQRAPEASSAREAEGARGAEGGRRTLRAHGAEGDHDAAWTREAAWAERAAVPQRNADDRRAAWAGLLPAHGVPGRDRRSSFLPGEQGAAAELRDDLPGAGPGSIRHQGHQRPSAARASHG